MGKITFSQYREREEELEGKLRDLICAYSFSEFGITTGMAITNGRVTIRVSSISVDVDGGCFYRGVELRKNGKPYKNGKKKLMLSSQAEVVAKWNKSNTGG